MYISVYFIFLFKKLHEKNRSREFLKISLSPIISTQILLNELQKQTHGTDATAVTCPPAEHRGTREATVYGRPFWPAAARTHPMAAVDSSVKITSLKSSWVWRHLRAKFRRLTLFWSLISWQYLTPVWTHPSFDLARLMVESEIRVPVSLWRTFCRSVAVVSSFCWIFSWI